MTAVNICHLYAYGTGGGLGGGQSGLELEGSMPGKNRERKIFLGVG